ncbi:hypothetical protein CR513_08304, partial [Mucuna pruriens]
MEDFELLPIDLEGPAKVLRPNGGPRPTLSRPGPIPSNSPDSSPMRSGSVAYSTSAIQHRGQLSTSMEATSSIEPLYAFDPEIEKTLRRLGRTRNLIVNNSRSYDSIINSNQLCTDNSVASSNIFAEPGQMKNNDRTLKELATPDVVYQSWCIRCPQLEPPQTYELKRGPPQAFEGIRCGLLHNEAVRDIGRLHQNEGASILPGWSSEGLVVPSTNTVQHLGRHEAHIPRVVLFGIQNCIYYEGNMWDKAAYKRDST